MGAKKKSTTTAKAKDPRGRAEALRDSLVLEHRAPRKDGKQTALHDGWRVILKSKASRYKRRANDLVKAKRWIYDDDDVSTRLSGEEVNWNHVVRQIIRPLYSELGGALFQYHRIRFVWRKKMIVGMIKGKNAPIGSKKHIASQKKSAAEAAAKAKAKMMESYKETMDEVIEGWKKKRELLAAQMKQLQALTATLQSLEEARIKHRLRYLSKANEKEFVRKKLKAMRLLRLDAKSFLTESGYGSSVYGQLIGKWLGLRRSAARKTG